MSKIADALKRVNMERAGIISPTKEKYKFLNNFKMGGTMRKPWLMWGIIIVVLGVFVVFNYQGSKDAVPLSEIFPDEEAVPVDVEYEYVQDKAVADAPGTVAGAAVADQTQVLKEAVVPTLAAVAPQPSTATTPAAYTIQIASFKDKKRAEEALASIRANVPSAYIATRDLGEKGTWYRIYAGSFNARQEAEISLNDIKKNYNGSFIISPK